MIPKDEQDIIVKKVIGALKEYRLGVIVLRPNDGSLVIYINDDQSAIKDLGKLNDENFQGGN